MGTQIQLKSKELDGTDYVYVYADGNPIQNGDELRSAVATAYSDFNVTGRVQTVLMGPGTYDMNLNPLFLDKQIKLEGLSSDRNSTIIKSITAPNQQGTFADLATESLQNVFYESFRELSALNFNFSASLNRLVGVDYVYAESNSQFARLSKFDGSYEIFNKPSGYSNSLLIIDEATGQLFWWAYSFSLSSYVFLRLNNNNLTIDNSFAPITLNSQVEQVIVDQSTNSVFIRGYFSVVGGFSRNRIAKINSDGSLDLTFTPGTGFNSSTTSMAFMPATYQLVVTGYFSDYNGNAAQFATIIDSNTAAYIGLSGQTSPFNSPAVSVYFDSANANLLFTGQFSSYNGLSFNRAVKTDLSGGTPTQLFLNIPTSNVQLKQNAYIKNGVIYVIGTNSSYDGTSYVFNSILKIDYYTGALIDVINLVPGVPSFGGGLYTFFDQNSTEYIFAGYYVSSTTFPAINIQTSMWFEQVYLRNLYVDGILLNNTRLFVDNIYSNVYMDKDYYNGSLYPNGNSGIEMINSSFNSLNVTVGEIRVYDNSYIGEAKVNPYLQGSTYINFIIRDSIANNVFSSSQRVNFGQLEITRSDLNNSFNNFASTPYASYNNYAGNSINDVRVTDSRLSYCFVNSICPQIYAKNSLLDYAFSLESGASNEERGFYVNWNISGCTGSGSLIFDTGKTSTSYPDSISDIFATDCNFQRNAFYINSVISQAPYRIYFSNIHITDAQSQSMYLYLQTIDKIQPWESESYNWYNGVIFDNCSVVNQLQWSLSMNAIAITVDEDLTTPGTLADLKLQNFAFNNCHVRINGEMQKALNLEVISNKRGVLISNTNYTNCSFSTRSGGSGAFINGIETFGNLDMNNVQFDNCMVYNGGQGFISKVKTNGQYFYANLISFRDCESNTWYNFMSDVSTGTFSASGVDFFDCRSSDYSFLTNISVSNWEQSGYINFENCEAGSDSFVCQSPFPYTPVYPSFRFINCIAGNQSFVKSFLSPVFAYFNFCKAGDSSYGNNYFNPSAGVLEMTVVGGAQHCSAGYGSFGTYAGPIYGGPGYFSFNEAQGSFSSITGIVGLYNN